MEETKKLLQLYRGVVVSSKEVAIEGIKGLPTKLVAKGMKIDGTPVVARYTDEEGEIVSVFAVLHQQGDKVGATICANLDEVNALISSINSHLDTLDTQVSELSSTTEDLQEQIDDLAENAVVSKGNTIVITAESGKTNIDVNVDGETIVIAEGGALNAQVTLTYVPANEDGGAKLELKRADDEVVSTIDVADILGNGMLKGASYDKATGILTLIFGTASGEEKPIEVDLKALLDIDDVIIAEGSENYLGVDLIRESGDTGLELSAKIVAIDDASEDKTGLVDAYNAKQIFDTKVDWVPSSETRKHILLANHDSILGTSTDGAAYNLAMVSKWDVADFGSAQLPMNLNSKDGIVTINDKKVVATTDNIDAELDNIATAAGLVVDTTKKTSEEDHIYYMANSGASFISEATSLNDADVKLDAALAEVVANTVVYEGSECVSVETVEVEEGESPKKVVKLNHTLTSDTDTAGFCHTVVDGVTKLDISFDFGIEDWEEL